jgi:hypothetical protein
MCKKRLLAAVRAAAGFRAAPEFWRFFVDQSLP